MITDAKFVKDGSSEEIPCLSAEYSSVKAENVLQVANVQLSRIMGIPEYTNYELSDELTLNNFDETFENTTIQINCAINKGSPKRILPHAANIAFFLLLFSTSLNLTYSIQNSIVNTR